MAAQEIGDRKETKFIELQNERDNPKPKGTFSRAFDYLKLKVSQLKAMALGKDIELYESVGGEEALKDVILALAHLQKHHEQIIKDSKLIPLDDQLADMVISEKCYKILETTKVPAKDVPISGDGWKVGKNEEVEKIIECNNKLYQLENKTHPSG